MSAPALTVIVYPVPTSYAPGTYTAPEQVVTVTESEYVYVCPYTQEGVPAPSKVPETPKEKPSTPVYEAPKEKPSAPVYEAPSKVPETPKQPQTTKEAPSPVYSTPVYEKPSEAPKTPKTQPKKPSSGGSLRGGNDHYGITYTPYESSNGDCKSSDQVDKDIGELKEAGFQIVRSYSTDCDTLSSVGGACKNHGMDMIIGVFVKGSGCSYDTPDIKEQVDAIAKWAQWDMVKLFVVGNEAIMNGFCSATELRDLIKVVKSKCSGYTGPYTIAETLNIWEQPETKAAICGVVDVTGANIHPYFNAEVTPSDAGTFVSGQLEILSSICEGNDVINLECGWPSQGNCNGSACPGKDEQAEAIKSIRESCGDKTVFFSYEDDKWKEPGSCGCEQSWGCKSAFY
ncbi:hypothetical protein NM208_g13810 [Fusarium decemcellulare]|uniref:Uncharacterized protein n=1 Tax=Fusarium decemcellulare TaxID=57161 RepID=A0ACC1RMM0_9HYPO|nr:hypothetical protein NM208_g13810 [Fusarium decemcellulare]